MAARIRKTTLSDEWKEKIKVGVILDRLAKHVHGEIEMTSSQIKAAEILLRKTVPDLGRQEVVGAGDNGEHLHAAKIVVELVRPNAPATA